MLLKPGSGVTIDGRNATVIATDGRRICAKNENGLTLVRDINQHGDDDYSFSIPPMPGDSSADAELDGSSTL